MKHTFATYYLRIMYLMHMLMCISFTMSYLIFFIHFVITTTITTLIMTVFKKYIQYKNFKNISLKYKYSYIFCT